MARYGDCVAAWIQGGNQRANVIDREAELSFRVLSITLLDKHDVTSLAVACQRNQQNGRNLDVDPPDDLPRTVPLTMIN